MSSPASYTHHPLPSSHHIRLLEFPGNTDEDRPLKVTIRVVDIEEATIPYVALSYTWGEPNFSKDLLLDGDEVLRITPSLAAALRRFRYASALRWIWVDAICINQQDDAEKTMQIPLMGKIYRRASRVMVWLGDRVQDTDLLHQTKRLVGTILDPHEDDALATELMVCLSQLAGLPWFSRRWIIQELALNSNAVLCCGHAELPWAHLAPAFQLVDDKAAALKNIRLLWDLWRNIAMPVWPKKKDSKRELLGDCDIAALMKSCSDFECLDDHDRIAALLGLSTDTRSGFTVNYAKSVEETFLVFATSLARSGHMAWLINLSLQRRIGRIKQDQTLPSWVPDWRVTIPRHERPSELDTKFFERAPCDIQERPVASHISLLTAKFPDLYGIVAPLFHDLPVDLNPRERESLLRWKTVSPAPLQVVWKSVLFPKDSDLAERMTLSLVGLWPWVLARLSGQQKVSNGKEYIWRELLLLLFKSLTYSVDYDSHSIEMPTLRVANDYWDQSCYHENINDLEALRSYVTAWIRVNRHSWDKNGGLLRISCLILCRETSRSETLFLSDVCVMGSLDFPFYHTVDIGDKVLLADLGSFHSSDGFITSALHDCRHIVREHPAFDGTDSAWSKSERSSLGLLPELPYANGSYKAASQVVYEFIAPCKLSSIFAWGNVLSSTWSDKLGRHEYGTKCLIGPGRKRVSIWVR